MERHPKTYPSYLSSVNPADYPTLTVPEDQKHCLPEGQTTVNMTWPRVNATDADGNAVSCQADGGTDVSDTGGQFPSGNFTVNCSVANNACGETTASFLVIIAGQRTPGKSNHLNLYLEISTVLESWPWNIHHYFLWKGENRLRPELWSSCITDKLSNLLSDVSWISCTRLNIKPRTLLC